MVLMAADGMTNKVIATKLGTDNNGMGRWGVPPCRRAGRDCQGAAPGQQPWGHVLEGGGGAGERGASPDDADHTFGRHAVVVSVDGA